MTSSKRSFRQLCRRLTPVGIPLVIALVLLGPGLGPGALMNLDLMVLPRMEVPSGWWGLGPEFPRRVPLWVPISMISGLVPATLTTKLLLVAVIVAGWLGMRRWATTLGVARPEIAAALYALSPFFLTRLGVGHVGMVLAASFLPWAAPHLLDPSRDRRRTFLAAAGLGLCGYAGGVLAVVVVVVAIVVRAPRAIAGNLATMGTAIAAQASWLVPAIVVSLSVSTSQVSSAPFGVQVGDHPLGVLSLSAGDGYWNTYFQVGPRGWITILVGAALLALAVMGTARLPSPTRRVLTVGAAVAWVVAALSAFDWTDGLFTAVTGTVVGGPLRDPQRLMTLHLLWLAPAASLGAERLADVLRRHRPWDAVSDVAVVAPVAASLVLVTPAAWGLGGNMDAVPVPSSWNQARALIADAPGPTVALPWTQYLNQDLPHAPVRRVLNPMPYLLSGDVISSSDNRLADDVREVGDPREIVLTDALAELIEDGAPVSDVLARLGVRWIVLQTTTSLADRYGGLFADPGLRVDLRGDELTVFAVIGWNGIARDDGGGRVEVSQIDEVVYRLAGGGEGPVVLARAGAAGWMQGWSRADTNEDGLLVLPGDSGLVWNVATPITVLGHLGFAAALVVVSSQVRRRATLANSPDPQ